MTTTTGPTGAVLALKPLAEAKSRLDLPAPLRRRLALAMFCDTLAALAGAVDRTVVISRQPALRTLLGRAGIPAGVEIRAEELPGLNAAFAQGDRVLREAGCRTVVACVGDLPTLRSDDLAAAITATLGAAAGEPPPGGTGPQPVRAFVPDASGIGTCLLIATGTALDPHFQGPSAARHAASGARPLVPELLDDRPAMRHDVDTADDLRRAVRFGLGPMTRALIDPRTLDLGHWQPVTVAGAPARADEEPADPGERTVITDTGHRLVLPVRAQPDRATGSGGTGVLRPGQRLDAVIGTDGILSTWW